MTARQLSAPDAALLALFLAGAAMRPAPSNAAAEAIADLRRRGLIVRVIGGYVLSPAGTAKARTLAGVKPAAETIPGVPSYGGVVREGRSGA